MFIKPHVEPLIVSNQSSIVTTLYIVAHFYESFTTQRIFLYKQIFSDLTITKMG